MAASYTPGPDDPGELSPYEQKILTGIEDEIHTTDPDLARRLTDADRLGTKLRAVARHGAVQWSFIPVTNAIESVNSQIRRAVKARGHFPNEAAALKCVYMAIMSLDPTGTGQRRWSIRWKPALNAFDMAFDGRLSAGRK